MREESGLWVVVSFLQNLIFYKDNLCHFYQNLWYTINLCHFYKKKFFFLSRLPIQHGAWTQNPKIKSHMYQLSQSGAPFLISFFKRWVDYHSLDVLLEYSLMGEWTFLFIQPLHWNWLKRVFLGGNLNISWRLDTLTNTWLSLLGQTSNTRLTKISCIKPKKICRLKVKKVNR